MNSIFNLEVISSKENPKIKEIKKLTESSSYRNKKGLYIIDGLRLCNDAAENGVSIDFSFLTEGFINQHKEKAEKIIGCSAKSYSVSDAIMKKLTDTTSPQGVICVCEMAKNDNFAFKPNGKYVILENIADPSNLGGIARTAEALGIDAIIVSGGCDRYSPKALRSSMGALCRFPIISTDNLSDTFFDMKKSGIKIYAAVLENSEKLNNCNFDGGCAVIIGNEANGISEETKKISDYRVSIPMSGKAESLNAHAAAAIFIWEMTK